MLKHVMFLAMAVGAAACGGSGDEPPDAGLVFCQDLQHAVAFSTQRMETCVVQWPDPMSCPAVVGAYCGSAADCGSGWDLVCNPESSGVNCIANPPNGCHVDGGGTVTFGYRVTYNGVDGVIEVVDNMCKFVACE